MDMQYAIFDMDGLLIDSEPLWMSTQAALLHELYGIAPGTQDLHAWKGVSSRAFCEDMARLHAGRGVEAGTLFEALIARMGRAIVEAPLMPGAVELIDWLRERHVGLAIASSSPLPFIAAVVRRHALPIAVFASGTEVPRSKPHPAVFELAAERLGAQRHQCRVWEDSLNGVIAARAAGMPVVAVPDPAHPGAERFAIADRVHRTLHESLAELNAADPGTPTIKSPNHVQPA
ncbi:HAD family hydrolase [Azotobacter vinelandii]|nr:HAD family phosphatase [Azotobacter vinelandii]